VEGTDGTAITTIAGVPVVGSSGTELFGAILPASLERRRAGWFLLVAERLRARDDRGIAIEDPAPALEGAHLDADSEVLEMVLRDLGDRGPADTGMLGGVVTEHPTLDRISTQRRNLLSFVRLM
jgi:hypothetical protein